MTLVAHDTARRVLVYDVPDVQKITACVPGAKHLYNGFVAVPAELYPLQLCTWLGLVTTGPMDADYDWPISAPFKPLWHQKIMANFSALNPRSFNLSDMGTMKTLSTLWAAEYVMLHYPPGQCRCLINAPLSTLQRVWGNTIFTHFMNRRTYQVLHGTADQRRKQLAIPADFYIINHDGLGTGARRIRNPKRGQPRIELDGFSKELKERTDIVIGITDEASAYKAHNTDRHFIAERTIATLPYHWELSGTPTPNGPENAYGLAKLVNNAHGESFNTYRRRVMFQVSKFKWVPMKGSHIEASKMLTPAVRFTAAECIDLPPCTVQQRDVPLSKDQQKAFAELRRNLQLIVSSGYAITPANEAALRSKLIQISCGVVYSGEGKDRREHPIDAGPRLAIAKEVVEQATRKVLIFAPFTSVVKLLYKEFDGYSREMIYGDVTAKERDIIFKAFQEDEEPRLLVADAGTMAHGLDLFAAATVLWYGPTDKTELYLQANKRIHRPGQTQHTTIVQLASNPIEREIYRRLDANESLQGVVLALIKGENYGPNYTG